MIHRNSIFFILVLVLAVWKHSVHGQESPLLRNRANTKEVMTDQQVDATSSFDESRDLSSLSQLLGAGARTAARATVASDSDEGNPDPLDPLYIFLGVEGVIIVIIGVCKHSYDRGREDLEQQDAKAVDPRENTDEENTTTSSEAAVAR